VARKVAAKNLDIEFDDRIVDNMCMQLVLRPTEYDVLCCLNLYGDIISDLGAGMIGGLGLAPGRTSAPSALCSRPRMAARQSTRARTR
jgi:isocitrate dehydrogenase (NAD+)